MTKNETVKRMHTSRSQLDRIRDAGNDRIQLDTVFKAARAWPRSKIGTRLANDYQAGALGNRIQQTFVGCGVIPESRPGTLARQSGSSNT